MRWYWPNLAWLSVQFARFDFERCAQFTHGYPQADNQIEEVDNCKNPLTGRMVPPASIARTSCSINTQSNRVSSNQSLCCRETNFAGRDKGAETAPEDQGDHCRDTTHASNPANSALLAQS
jgi:hypothetical protein